MFVLTIDQRGSRSAPDRVPELLAQLAELPTRLPFERTVGDELQGLLEDPVAVVAAMRMALRDGHWHIGIGVGSIQEPLPSRAPAAAGAAFLAAREAVTEAKKAGERAPVALRLTPPGAAGAVVDDVRAGIVDDAGTQAAAAEAVLILIGDLIRRRSAAEWRVIDALEATPGARQVTVARELGISPQAVSKALVRSGWVEERQGAAAAVLLLRLCARSAR